MTLDQIIASIGSFGALLSALAALAAATGTFVTVRQMRRQTEASYRPELTFARVEITASAEKANSIALEHRASLMELHHKRHGSAFRGTERR
jgi:hypothetical protein